MKQFIKVTILAAVALAVMGCGSNKGVVSSAPGPVKLTDPALAPQLAPLDANGFYNLHSAPNSFNSFGARVVTGSDGSKTVMMSYGSKHVGTLELNTSGDEVRWVDANFDGFIDVVIGPATSRNYTAICLQEPKSRTFKQSYVTDELNGDFILNPNTKQWVGRSSNSASSTIYQIYSWSNNHLVPTETLIVITDPRDYAANGVKDRYTIINGNDFQHIAASKKKETSKITQLPAEWLRILNSFENL